MPSSRRRAKHAGGQLALEELQPGDIVVHAVHGIGRYVGMEHRSVGGAERDYLVLAYDQGDKLYLPSEQVELIAATSAARPQAVAPRQPRGPPEGQGPQEGPGDGGRAGPASRPGWPRPATPSA